MAVGDVFEIGKWSIQILDMETADTGERTYTLEFMNFEEQRKFIQSISFWRTFSTKQFNETLFDYAGRFDKVLADEKAFFAK